MWFLDQLEPGGAQYHLPVALRLAGKLDVSALTASLSEIVRRHESLRTVFRKVEGEPRQMVLAPSSLSVPVVDLSGLPGSAGEAEAMRLSTLEARRPFDLAAGPLLRASLVRLADEAWIALLNVHHIVSDGWSQGVLVDELVALYGATTRGARASLPELPIQYGDFALWQREWLAGEVVASQVQYWREALAGAPPLLALPVDRPRPPVQTFRGANEAVRLPAPLTAELKALGQREGATLFMTLFALWTALLSRVSGQDDVPVGTVVANRTRLETEALIGFFVNTLVLRGRFAERPTVAALLAQVRRTALGAYAHQDLPFERLVEELSVERSLSYGPLFQVMFVLQNAPGEALELPGLTLAPVEVSGSTAKFDLTLALWEVGEETLGQLEYSTDLFDATTVRRLFGHFATLLTAAAQRTEARVGELLLLSPAERHQLLTEWADTATPAAPAVGGAFEPIVRHVERWAASEPGALALVSGEERVSYGELDARASRVARALRQLGVEREVRVGILLPRSIELVVAELAVWKAGGAYVPLDPSSPEERQAWLVRDLWTGQEVRLLLSHRELITALGDLAGETGGHLL
ncbi:MAG TPA: condensation domain-containing protein, partial [Thermoanaerobaculia bacterium]